MNREAYKEALHEAYQGEVFGRYVGEELLAKMPENDKYVELVRAFGALEDVTAQLLRPILVRYGVDLVDNDEIRKLCQAVVETVDGWEQLNDKFTDAVHDMLRKFEIMAEVADDRDRIVMGHLVRHEQLLVISTVTTDPGKIDQLVIRIRECTEDAHRILAQQCSA